MRAPQAKLENIWQCIGYQFTSQLLRTDSKLKSDGYILSNREAFRIGGRSALYEYTNFHFIGRSVLIVDMHRWSESPIFHLLYLIIGGFGEKIAGFDLNFHDFWLTVSDFWHIGGHFGSISEELRPRPTYSRKLIYFSDRDRPPSEN